MNAERNPTMKFILIRHGETYANSLYNTEERILIGAHDAPVTYLNDTGKAQAASTHSILKDTQVDDIYVSDLTRTKQTASIVFPQRTFHYTPLLRERSLGSDQGKRASDIFQNEDAWNYHVDLEKDTLEQRLTKRVPDGENYLMVIDRCRTFLNQFNFNEKKTVAIVAHFHFIRCLIYVLLSKTPDLLMFELMIPNAEPIVFEYDGNQFHWVKY